MKPPIRKSPIAENQALEVKYLTDAHFDPNWHFHSEYQVFTVLHGTGTRFIGDALNSFKPGDIVFTGPNLPHLWRSDPEYFDMNSELRAEGIVIYFREKFLSDDVFRKSEGHRIKQLFHKASRGIAFHKSTADEASQLMVELLHREGFERVITMMTLLNLMANTIEYEQLASEGYTNFMKKADSERMNRVHTFVMKNFRSKIDLFQISEVANLSPSAFSRYFKAHSNKTFNSFLTEIRISYSCKLLLEQKISVSEACFESGFNTLSNFNRQFKSVTQCSPLAYRKKFAEIL